MSKEFRLGVFIVAMLLIFAGLIFWIGNKQFMFNRTYLLYAEFPNVAGLANGADVRVGGIHEGSVRRIDLPPRPDQKIRVEMDLKGPTRAVVRKDSMATIRTEGLVGDMYVEISFGSAESPEVKSGDTIGSEPPLEMSDLMKKTNAILDSAQGAVQNLSGTTKNLEAISSKINRGQGTMGALVNDKSVYQHVAQGATELQEDMEALKHNFLLRGFFNKRGYEDTAELTKYAIAQLPSKPYARRFDYDTGKLFDKADSAKLRKEKQLDEAGKYLEANPYGLAVVAAYAGAKGDTDKDRVLTQARSMVVREYLVNHFKLDDTRIKTIGLGKLAEAGDQSRVEILVYPPGTSEPPRQNSADRSVKK